MMQINVADKTHIKQLLYSGLMLGVKDDCYSSFDGFQIWWYDKSRDLCSSCASGWADPRKRIEHCSLDDAARTLWQRRGALFVRNRDILHDPKLAAPIIGVY